MTARFVDHILPADTLANRPAANAVPVGTLYPATDTATIYRSDGSSWSVWAALGGSTDQEVVRDTIAAALVQGSGVTITPDDAANTITIAASGGGASAWTASANSDLSSLTGFASVSGTWAINAGVTRQSSASSTPARLRFDTKLPLNHFIVQVDCQLISGSGDQRMGVILGSNANGDAQTSVFALVLDPTQRYVFDRYEFARDVDINGAGVTVGAGTWRTIRVAVSGTRRALWVDGTLIRTVDQPVPIMTDISYVHLVTKNAVVDFRNFKVWTPSLPA